MSGCGKGATDKVVGSARKRNIIFLHAGGCPLTFSSCSFLFSLNLCNNRLSVDFLTWVIMTIPYLRYFFVAFNYLICSVPLSLTECTRLQVIDLISNAFTAENPGDQALPATTFGTSGLTNNGSKAIYPDPVTSGKGNGVFGLPTLKIYRRSDRLDLLLFRAHLESAALAWASPVHVPELVMHSVPTPSPTMTTGFRTRLILNFGVPSQASGVAFTTSADSTDLHGFVQPGAVLFRYVIGVRPISADLPIFGDKPLCVGDGEAKGWSTACFWAIMLIHIQHGEH